jgi:hypothetical protein
MGVELLYGIRILKSLFNMKMRFWRQEDDCRHPYTLLESIDTEKRSVTKPANDRGAHGSKIDIFCTVHAESFIITSITVS